MGKHEDFDIFLTIFKNEGVGMGPGTYPLQTFFAESYILFFFSEDDELKSLKVKTSSDMREKIRRGFAERPDQCFTAQPHPSPYIRIHFVTFPVNGLR